MNILNGQLEIIKGVGPKRANMLKKLGLRNVSDIIYYFPKSYDDRSKISNLKDAKIGERVNLIVEIRGEGKVSYIRRNLSIFKIPFKDNSGEGQLIWFNQNYLKGKFKVGDEYRVSGKLNLNKGTYTITNPDMDKTSNIEGGSILPIYPLTKGLSNNQICKIIENALNLAIDYIEETIPRDIRVRYSLIEVREALRNIHFPLNRYILDQSRRRLIFEELFTLQLGLFFLRYQSGRKESGIIFKRNMDEEAFIDRLDFKLTNAQKKSYLKLIKIWIQLIR